MQRCAIESAGRAGRSISLNPSEAAAVIGSALIYSEGSRPLLGDFRGLSASRCSIEIPNNINALKESEPKLGVEWRKATRAAFLAALDDGFFAEDFVRVEGSEAPRWFYLLKRRT